MVNRIIAGLCRLRLELFYLAKTHVVVQGALGAFEKQQKANCRPVVLRPRHVDERCLTIDSHLWDLVEFVTHGAPLKIPVTVHLTDADNYLTKYT